MNLFQLTNGYRQIIEMSGDLEEAAFKDTLESIEEPLGMKMANYVKVIRAIEADIDAIDKESKRLAEFKASKKKTIERLKNVLLDSVEIVGEETNTGGKRFVIYDDPFVKMLWSQKSPPKINILDETKIPKKYYVPQPKKLDSAAILAALKDNKKVRGVEIQQLVGVRYK